MRRRARGFTLIEVMLALALIGVLAGSVMGFLWSLSSRQAGLSRLAAESQGVDTLLDRLEGDLLGGLAGDAKLGAGIDGSATRLRLLTRGVDLADGGTLDLQEAVYSFSGGTLVLSRGPAGPGSEGIEAERHALASGLARVRFRYFDGRNWKSSFDSAALRRLPAAIEVCVWRAGREPLGSGEETGAGDSAAGGAGSALPWPEPDRSRVIIVPDGPDAAWGGGANGGASGGTGGAP